MKLPEFATDLLLQLAYAALTHVASEVAAKVSRRERIKANIR